MKALALIACVLAGCTVATSTKPAAQRRKTCYAVSRCVVEPIGEKDTGAAIPQLVVPK